MEVSQSEISANREIQKGLKYIKTVYEYDDELVNESHDDEWAEVGAAFDEFRQRLWEYTRQDRVNRMEFFQDCMKRCEEALKEYYDICVAED